QPDSARSTPRSERSTPSRADAVGTWPTYWSYSTRDPNCRRRAPDRETDEEVGKRNGHDRDPYRPAHGGSHTGGTARGAVPVVTVQQDDQHTEQQHFQERIEHVHGRQEQREIVLVATGRHVVEKDHDQS